MALVPFDPDRCPTCRRPVEVEMTLMRHTCRFCGTFCREDYCSAVCEFEDERCVEPDCTERAIFAPHPTWRPTWCAEHDTGEIEEDGAS